MSRFKDALRLRIYLSSNQKAGHIPLYEAIALKARDFGMAGATVFRSPFSFGRTAVIYKLGKFAVFENLGIVVEIIDLKEKIDAFIPVIRQLSDDVLIEQATVQMIRYGR